MNEKVFGYREDGTLSLCRSLPENRGKPPCFHSEHITISSEELKSGFLQKHNEEAVKKHFEQTGIKYLSKDSYPHVQKNAIQSHTSGAVLTERELEISSGKIANAMDPKKFQFIQKFYDEFHAKLQEKGKNELRLSSRPIEFYINSDEPSAIRLRKFLGKDIDVSELSEILTIEVGSMTASRKWKMGRVPIQRAILTTLNNDMNRRRYVASVLFFGGRCCYCNKPLKKKVGDPHQATGEHITPVSPENKNDPVGSTRYGNMALACRLCNKSRGNKELTEWIRTTDRIKKKDKPLALGRIIAFRDFAMYEDYSKEQSEILRSEIKRVNNFINSKRNKAGQIGEKEKNEISQEIAKTLYNLNHLK